MAEKEQRWFDVQGIIKKLTTKRYKEKITFFELMMYLNITREEAKEYFNFKGD